MVKEVSVSYGRDEDNDFYSNDDLYNINSWGADLSFREIISQYAEGDILKPQLQRHYVWDKSEASRFIDSILMGLPVPSVFFAKTPDEKMLIIDGYQRIMTVYDFVRGIFSGDSKTFALTNSDKINKRWRGKSFLELSDIEQRKIKNTTIHCIIFIQTAPKDNDTSMYQIFERINTSGRTLMPQEIRNCVYFGKLNEALFEMNENSAWRTLFGSEVADSRMRDMELILRYFAIKDIFENKAEIRIKQISLKKYLNEYMQKLQSSDATTIEGMKIEFYEVMSIILNKVGENAFRNLSDGHSASSGTGRSAGIAKFSNRFNAPIFDSMSIAIHSLRQQKSLSEELGRSRIELLLNPEYQDLIRTRTTHVDRIADRVNLAIKILDN
ncbi:hypothetical protein GCM10008959_28810 [Deinococcus seoulensis]|uniref:GmrSD restriction endonucleases N-terminal domain-containing protein n=1 Tax=Deinococcus seoulensis TaxID=1837379 RepID=A0ABQ2RU68_9DEIO|nr:DUF262 domain-containing protein [Deinococcus seoulensis]GGR64903.1 hypothetical protein GCM10008959_28810 [Deinococcus seoulensis]